MYLEPESVANLNTLTMFGVRVGGKLVYCSSN